MRKSNSPRTIIPNTPLKRVLELGSECDRNGRCCRHGSGIVLRQEVPGLAKALGVSEAGFVATYLDGFENLNTKHYRLKQKKERGRPHGRCVFLKGEAECSIHEIKPQHCRVTSCCSKKGEELSLWFMLKHFLNREDSESVRQYELYLKTGGKTLGDEDGK